MGHYHSVNDSNSNSHEQFSLLLLKNQRRLYGFIFTLVQDHAATDDILQEAASLLWSKFDSFEPGTDFGAWAMKVARFKVLEWRRRQQHLPLPIEEELLLELAGKAEITQETDGLGRLEALEHCVAKLNDQDGALLNQRYSEGHSVSGIAKKAGTPRDTIYKKLARIHRNLQTCIENQLNKEIPDLS